MNTITDANSIGSQGNEVSDTSVTAAREGVYAKCKRNLRRDSTVARGCCGALEGCDAAARADHHRDDVDHHHHH